MQIKTKQTNIYADDDDDDDNDDDDYDVDDDYDGVPMQVLPLDAKTNPASQLQE